MGYYTLMVFGCLVGMQHALEADHLAAVAAMSTGRTSRRTLIIRGGLWGLGHTATLLLICGVLIVFGGNITPRTEALLEIAVGAMLALLGANVLRTLWLRRPHAHVHEHEDGLRHIHVHTHARSRDGDVRDTHHHDHENLKLGRAIAIGMVHGAAGSAALLVLATTAESTLNAFGYVLAFGLGSIVGMAALSLAASYPLKLVERSAGWITTATTASIGGAAVVVGGLLFASSWGAL